ncbi:hypothetical protein ACFV06_35690 [Streptomyces sp. NPDC059618]|uniref:hypothetical protein n=1 Tax=Streptomyces sp. NPDC059618 TaxID=3346887 RepID=UPI0036D19CFD
MAENVEPNEETTETPAEETPEVVAHAASNVAWCGVHQEASVDEPEVVAHSEEGEDTPWCGIHQEHNA